jgi:PAS domain S-box-containing protein
MSGPDPAGGSVRKRGAGAGRIELAEFRGLLEHARKTEEAWQLLMESVKDFAILLLDPDGRIASWNEGGARLLGYTADEMIGQPLALIFIPEDRAKDRPGEELKQAASTGRSIDDNWLLRKDGTRFWASGVTTPLRGPDGTLLGFAKVVRDLTERKLAEESLQKANEALEERVQARTGELELRLRELEGFASSVAHDLRAPLRSIHRYAEILRSELPGRDPSGESDRILERILEGAERMDLLIEHLLAYGRVGDTALQIEVLDLHASVASVLTALQGTLEERQGSVELDEPLPTVLSDRELLFQVIANLVSNAAKFVPPGVCPRIRIRAERLRRGVRLWVEDNGIGIAPEHQDRIFLPFERLHAIDEYPGTGIGLAIVKRAAERMGGAVGVESQPGRGSRFWVDLPSADGDGR